MYKYCVIVYWYFSLKLEYFYYFQENADETAPTYIEATEENYIMQQQCVSTVSVPLQERIQADTQVEENACQELLECSNENQIEEQNETNKQKSPEKVVAEECTINLIDIEDYLENIALRQTWCWIKKLHCIVLIQIDSRTLQIRCLLKIHSDLSVTVKIIYCFFLTDISLFIWSFFIFWINDSLSFCACKEC